MVSLRRVDAVDVELSYALLRRALRQEFETFYYAFLSRQGLLVKPDADAPEPTEEELDRAERAQLMALGIEHVQRRKALKEAL